MTIVVGYRPDRFGEAALHVGIARAERSGEPLRVVSVSPGRDSGDVMTDETERLLEKRLEKSGADATLVRVAGRDVAEEILGVVATEQASSLVIGIRHRTAVGKMLLGSVAHRLIIDSPVDIVAAKPR